jgi:hypothetical protein
MRAWLLIGVFLLALSLTGCTGKANEPFKDADRGQTNNDPADTVTFPDGFSNVATKCDHGNRVYVIFKGDSQRAGLAVVPNAKGC